MMFHSLYSYNVLLSTVTMFYSVQVMMFHSLYSYNVLLSTDDDVSFPVQLQCFYSVQLQCFTQYR